MDRFSSVHPPFTLVPAQPVRVVLNASRDPLNEAKPFLWNGSATCLARGRAIAMHVEAYISSVAVLLCSAGCDTSFRMLQKRSVRWIRG